MVNEEESAELVVEGWWSRLWHKVRSIWAPSIRHMTAAESALVSHLRELDAELSRLREALRAERERHEFEVRDLEKVIDRKDSEIVLRRQEVEGYVALNASLRMQIAADLELHAARVAVARKQQT